MKYQKLLEVLKSLSEEELEDSVKVLIMDYSKKSPTILEGEISGFNFNEDSLELVVTSSKNEFWH